MKAKFFGKKLNIYIQVFTPDGFPIEKDKLYYDTYIQAEIALENWLKQFQEQGFFESIKGKINISDLESKCVIIKTTKLKDRHEIN